MRDAGLCDVFQVFGATGWQRRFRLTIEDNRTVYESLQQRIRAERFIYLRPKSGSYTIQVQSLATSFPPKVIGGLLQFIADWSALGAIIRELGSAGEMHSTMNGKAHYVRANGEWQFRAVIGEGQARPAVITILRSGKGRKRQNSMTGTRAGNTPKVI